MRNLIKIPRELWDEYRDTIRETYPTIGSKAIAEKYGVTPVYVRSCAADLGVSSDMALSHKRRGQARHKKNKDLSEKAPEFLRSWSPEAAYILGYIWADGCVNDGRHKSLIFGSVTSDECLLEYARSKLNPAAKIHRKPGKVRPDGTVVAPYSRPEINGPSVVETLKGMGFPPRKSFTDPVMPSVPDGVLRHFARGLFDGDGSIWFRGNTKIGSRPAALSFVGTPRFLNEFTDRICAKVGVRRPPTHNQNENTSLVFWSSREAVLRFLVWFYAGHDGFSLKRKRDKFFQCVLSPMRTPKRGRDG